MTKATTAMVNVRIHALFILGPTGHKPAESAAHAGSTAGAWRVRAAMAMMAPLDGH